MNIEIGDTVLLNTLGCAEGELKNWIVVDNRVDWTKPQVVESLTGKSIRVVGGKYWQKSSKFGLIKKGEAQ
jgi:hypothetical protein